MKEFKVLPTDNKFLDLTEEQLDLMYCHWLLDNKPIKTGIQDQDYQAEEDKNESYHDPDFDEEWNRDVEDEINTTSTISMIGKNNPNQQTEHKLPTVKSDIDLNDKDQWEEVE